jgi:hypothetical protein
LHAVSAGVEIRPYEQSDLEAIVEVSFGRGEQRISRANRCRRLIAVDPGYRRGIARQLTERASEHMRAQRMDIAAVGTGGDPGHGLARALYELVGYTALPGVRYLRLLD